MFSIVSSRPTLLFSSLSKFYFRVVVLKDIIVRFTGHRYA